MRRLVALMVLGAGGWMPVPAPTCPLAASGSDSSVQAAAPRRDPAADASLVHRHGEVSAAAAEANESGPRPHDGPCPRGSPCGAGMVGALPPTRAIAAAVHAVGDTVLRTPFRSVIPAREPPPPRLPV